jgi:hypothetical protein
MGTGDQMSYAEVRIAMERVHYAEGTASANIDRANEAEAEVERLTAALKEIETMKPIDGKPSDYLRGWNDSRHRMSRIASAALKGKA